MTKTSQTSSIVDDALESMSINFDGIPSESVALTWLRGYWSMNLELSGNDSLFDGFEDFAAAVASRI